MKKILITGAAGFIGSNLSNKIEKSNLNWDITLVDNLSSGKIEFLDSCLHEKLIISDFSAENILNKIKNKEFDYVFHLAAKPAVGYSVEYPYESNNENVDKTLKLLEACRENIKKFIFSSSSAIYGDIKALPIFENNEKNPNSPYGLQKYIIEQYLTIFKKLYNFNFIGLRYFNVYGRNNLGNSAYSTAVSAWLYAIKNNIELRFDGDGEQSRDMCHVDDIVNANILAAVSDCNEGFFNVGTGKSITNNEILELLKLKFNNIKIKQAPARHGDVKHTLADIKLTEEYLDYLPEIKFEDGLNDTIEWFMNTKLI